MTAVIVVVLPAVVAGIVVAHHHATVSLVVGPWAGQGLDDGCIKVGVKGDESLR